MMIRPLGDGVIWLTFGEAERGVLSPRGHGGVAGRGQPPAARTVRGRPAQTARRPDLLSAPSAPPCLPDADTPAGMHECAREPPGRGPGVGEARREGPMGGLAGPVGRR